MVTLNKELDDNTPIILCAHSLGGVLAKRVLHHQIPFVTLPTDTLLRLSGSRTLMIIRISESLQGSQKW